MRWRCEPHEDVQPTGGFSYTGASPKRGGGDREVRVGFPNSKRQHGAVPIPGFLGIAKVRSEGNSTFLFDTFRPGTGGEALEVDSFALSTF